METTLRINQILVWFWRFAGNLMTSLQLANCSMFFHTGKPHIVCDNVNYSSLSDSGIISKAILLSRDSSVVNTLVGHNYYVPFTRMRFKSRFSAVPPPCSVYRWPVAVCSYPGQGYDSATEHFARLVRSAGTVFHCKFVPHLHYQRSKTCSRHICSLVPTSLTNCLAEYEQRTLYGALLVTVAMLLRLLNCRFIVIIFTVPTRWRRCHPMRCFRTRAFRWSASLALCLRPIELLINSSSWRHTQRGRLDGGGAGGTATRRQEDVGQCLPGQHLFSLSQQPILRRSKSQSLSPTQSNPGRSTDGSNPVQSINNGPVLSRTRKPCATNYSSDEISIVKKPG